jgi:hypothetical protein
MNTSSTTRTPTIDPLSGKDRRVLAEEAYKSRKIRQSNAATTQRMTLSRCQRKGV